MNIESPSLLWLVFSSTNLDTTLKQSNEKGCVNMAPGRKGRVLTKKALKNTFDLLLLKKTSIKKCTEKLNGWNHETEENLLLCQKWSFDYFSRHKRSKVWIIKKREPKDWQKFSKANYMGKRLSIFQRK